MADRGRRELKTAQAMVTLYCRSHHGTGKCGDLCEDCRELLDYVAGRLDRCPYQQDKPVCAKCPIHCYRPAMREKIRAVMRYAGPRMLRHHPVLALRHLLDGRKEPPARPGKGADGGP